MENKQIQILKETQQDFSDRNETLKNDIIKFASIAQANENTIRELATIYEADYSSENLKERKLSSKQEDLIREVVSKTINFLVNKTNVIKKNVIISEGKQLESEQALRIIDKQINHVQNSIVYKEKAKERVQETREKNKERRDKSKKIAKKTEKKTDKK